MAAGISFQILLTDNQMSAEKWAAWFHKNPAALEVPCDIYNTSTVRGLLKHVWAVELRHSQRLLNEDVTAYDEIPSGSLDELFGVHTKAVGNLRAFLAQATDASLDEIMTSQTVSMGPVRASRRKLFTHIMLHSIRHWAQLATLLRQNGYATDWPKDFFFSEAME